MDVRLSFVCIAATFIMMSCSQVPTTSPQDQNDKCFQTIGGQRLFMGNERCLAGLPDTRISGYLVDEFENVTFQKTLDRTLNESRDVKDLTWMYVGKSIRKKIQRPARNERKIYWVEFIGSYSDEPGLYGHTGGYGSGVIIKRLISIKEIRSSDEG